VRSLHELLPQDAPALPIQATDPDGPMQLIFTSGTTGDPKGIVMTHRRYCDTSTAVWKLFGYEPHDRPYSGLSLTHANAQVLTLGAALIGGLRAVLSRRFNQVAAMGHYAAPRLHDVHAARRHDHRGLQRTVQV